MVTYLPASDPLDGSDSTDSPAAAAASPRQTYCALYEELQREGRLAAEELHFRAFWSQVL
jgi:hypothetical protein